MKIYASTGPFAGDKDAAAHIRDSYIRPELSQGRPVLLDFLDVGLATQSFVHALVAGVVREDPRALEFIEFRNCSSGVKQIIEIVVDYAQTQFE